MRSLLVFIENYRKKTLDAHGLRRYPIAKIYRGTAAKGGKVMQLPLIDVAHLLKLDEGYQGKASDSANVDTSIRDFDFEAFVYQVVGLTKPSN